jgi:hypothetical protein
MAENTPVRWEAEGALSTGMTFTEEGGPFHPSSSFGWQYLHMIGGEALVTLVFHATDIFGECHEPYISVGYLLGKDRGHVRLPVPDLGRSPGCPQGLRRTENGYLIDVDAGPVALAGTVTSDPAVHPSSTVLFQDGERTSRWELLAEHADFRGDLRVGATSRHCEGAFYMDRQWGDLPLQEYARDWTWGHIVASDASMVFLEVITQGGPTATRAVHRWAGAGDLDAAVRRTYLERLCRARRMSDVKGSYDIGFFAGGQPTDVSLSLDPSGLVHVRENEVHRQFIATYARWCTAGWARRDGSKLAVNGVTEYLRIRSR